MWKGSKRTTVIYKDTWTMKITTPKKRVKTTYLWWLRLNQLGGTIPPLWWAFCLRQCPSTAAVACTALWCCASPLRFVIHFLKVRVSYCTISRLDSTCSLTELRPQGDPLRRQQRACASTREIDNFCDHADIFVNSSLLIIY